MRTPLIEGCILILVCFIILIDQAAKYKEQKNAVPVNAVIIYVPSYSKNGGYIKFLYRDEINQAKVDGAFIGTHKVGDLVELSYFKDENSFVLHKENYEGTIVGSVFLLSIGGYCIYEGVKSKN